jgi:hypothetical protein
MRNRGIEKGKGKGGGVEGRGMRRKMGVKGGKDRCGG